MKTVKNIEKEKEIDDALIWNGLGITIMLAASVVGLVVLLQALGFVL